MTPGLTDEEIEELNGGPLSFTEDWVNVIADAQLRKALWWCVAEIDTIGGMQGSMAKGKAIKHAAEVLADYLNRQGIEPWEDHELNKT